jgi:hypothetical protein
MFMRGENNNHKMLTSENTMGRNHVGDIEIYVDYYKMDAGERVFEDTELLELFQDKMQW